MLDIQKRKNLPELELGAGLNTPRIPGRLNCDLYPGPNIDLTFDLMGEWPFEDNSISAIHANHVLEHLPNPVHFMREAWRVLAPSQTRLKTPNLFIRVPYGPSEPGVGDVTHIRYFSPTTWACWSPRYYEITGNPQHKNQPMFGCLLCACRVNGNLAWMVKPWFRRWGLRFLPYIWGGYTEMFVRLMKLTDDQVEWWKAQPEDQFIVVSRIMYEDEYNHQPIPKERKYICLDSTVL